MQQQHAVGFNLSSIVAVIEVRRDVLFVKSHATDAHDSVASIYREVLAKLPAPTKVQLPDHREAIGGISHINVGAVAELTSAAGASQVHSLVDRVVVNARFR